jgi:hypothetical protein
MTDEPRPRSRWRRPRVSVRALMGVVLVLAVALGFYVRSVHVQQDAMTAIRRAGGHVEYDWRWGNYNPDIEDYDGKWRAPMWLVRLVPVDYVANVVYVDLTVYATIAPTADDTTVAHVGRLGHLEQLRLNRTEITDASLAHLEGLTRLRHLQIKDTAVGDAGLAHLRGLTGLMSVDISGSRISDEARLDLERALPGVQINHYDELVRSGDSRRARDDLEFARSRPVRQATGLLVDRVRSLIARRDTPEIIATVEALCDLEAGDKLSLIKLAEGCSQCIGLLQPSQAPDIPAAERERLLRRCADRGIGALTRAVELGYDNVRRLAGDFREAHTLLNLHDHPDFPKVVEAAKANRGKR